MAMGRLNRPGIMIYGGTIRAGKAPTSGDSLDIVSAFQAYGEYMYDRITEEERKEIVQHACPGPGACGGMLLLAGLGLYACCCLQVLVVLVVVTMIVLTPCKLFPLQQACTLPTPWQQPSKLSVSQSVLSSIKMKDVCVDYLTRASV